MTGTARAAIRWRSTRAGRRRGNRARCRRSTGRAAIAASPMRKAPNAMSCGCSTRRRPITRCGSSSRAGIGAVAVWRLGLEDPGLWSIFGRTHRTLPAPSAINAIPAGTDVDIEGSGEILKIAGVPVEGVRHGGRGEGRIARRRSISSGFRRLMSWRGPAIKPGEVALTFDDGPRPAMDAADPRYPQARACAGDLLHHRRECADRAAACSNAWSKEGMRWAATPIPIPTWPARPTARRRSSSTPPSGCSRPLPDGRSRLFRAPYFGDAEPTTADEIEPALQAQNRGYTSVGLHVDPGDWKRPGVQTIIDETIKGVEASNASAAAISCCCTMRAATARRRSRRCR